MVRMTSCATSSDTGMALTDVLLSEWMVKMSQKRPFPTSFAKNLQKIAKRKWPQYAKCQRIVTILCVFAFLHSFFECFILPKDARFYFPSEFFAEIKKLPKFALCLEQSCTIFSILLLKRSRITTSEKLRAN